MGGYSATQIYQMFQQGPGPGRMYDAQDGAGVQLGAQDDVNNQILQLNQKMATAWGGNASEAAQSGAVPLANAAQDASDALAQHQAVMANQADAFNTARNSVTNVPSQMPNNVGNDLLAVIGDSGPLDDQVNAYNASSQHNVQVYQTYSQTSSATASEMPQTYGQIPVSNATITVVSPSSVSGSGARYTALAAVGGTGTAAADEDYAASRLSAPPSPGQSGETELSGAPEGSGIGTVDAPPVGDGGWHLPGLPNEPSITTNASGWVPPAETDVPPGGFFPGGATGGNNGNDEESSNPNGSLNPNFTGNLTGGVGPGGVGPGGVGGGESFGGSGGFGGGAGGGGAGGGGANALNGLHGGAAGGTGSNPSDITNSSRSAVGISSASEETMLGGGPGGPGAAAGEDGMPMGAAGGGQRGEDDREHRVAQYLQEADPDALFGTDEMTAPPVIGE